MPLLLAAFTSEGGRSDLLKPQDSSPRSRFRRPLRRPKRSANTGSGRILSPQIPSCGSVAPPKVCAATKRASRTFFSQIATNFWGLWRVLSLSPLDPLRVPGAQDRGLSRIYLPESGPARATRTDGLAGERTAGSGSLGLADAENELRVVRHAVMPCRRKVIKAGF